MSFLLALILFSEGGITMKKIIILLLLSVFSSQLFAELVIIGNLENNIAAPMTKKQVQELFMGRARFFSNGLRAVPLDVSDLRSSFYQRLTNRPIEQINAYWARLTFSGHSVPPAVLENQQAIINAVKQSKGGIAYIEGDNIDDSQVKLLLEIK